MMCLKLLGIPLSHQPSRYFTGRAVSSTGPEIFRIFHGPISPFLLRECTEGIYLHRQSYCSVEFSAQFRLSTPSATMRSIGVMKLATPDRALASVRAAIALAFFGV